MAQVLMCDFCNSPINVLGPVPVEHHRIVIDDGPRRDICDPCYTGSVILSEQRRVQTRRRRKPGRPRGSKAKAAPALPLTEVSGTVASCVSDEVNRTFLDAEVVVK